MKKILATCLLIMVFAGLWLAILGYIEPSRQFSIMVVLGLFISFVLSMTSTVDTSYIILQGKVIGVVNTEEKARRALDALPAEDCFVLKTTGVNLIKAGDEAEEAQ